MGGKYITAARLEDGRLISFIDHTSTDFNLCFDQKDFLKIAKKHGLLSIPRKNEDRFCYMFNNSFENVNNSLTKFNLYNTALNDKKIKKNYYKNMTDKELELIFSQNYYSNGFNSFLCSYWYGLNFFDFKNKKMFSFNDYVDNTRYLLYLFGNDIYLDLSEKDFRKSFDRHGYLSKLDELCKKGATLISNDKKSHDIADMNAWKVLQSIRQGEISYDSDYKVSLPEWQLFRSNDFNSKEESRKFLKQYLEDEKLITEIDQIAWKLDEQN